MHTRGPCNWSSTAINTTPPTTSTCWKRPGWRWCNYWLIRAAPIRRTRGRLRWDTGVPAGVRRRPGGPAPHWRAGCVRKVVRRAENKRWDAVQRLDGVTAASGRAQVRAFIPGPVSSVPPEIRKLQVGGTQLPRLHDSTQDDAWVTVELTPEVELSTGKAAAQVGHAAQLAYEHLSERCAARDSDAARVLVAWRQDGFRIRAVTSTGEQWAAADRPVRVLDAGLTEISGATETARAHW